MINGWKISNFQYQKLWNPLDATGWGSYGGTCWRKLAMSRANIREITTEVTMSPWASVLLLELGRLVRQRADDPRLGVTGGRWKYLPAGEFPLYPSLGRSWKVGVGGLTVSVRLPAPDGALLTDRLQANFIDGRIARNVWAMDKTHIRRSLLLSYVDSKWYARMKFQSKEGMVAKTDVHGHVTWKRSRKPRRWAVAPPDWPRKTNGDPMSSLGAARVAARKQRETGGS